MRLIILILPLAILIACNTPEKEVSSLEYPVTAKDSTVDNYFNTEVPDPYRWLEDDLSEETAQWVKAQNEVTFGYLEKIPYREKLKSRLESLWNYERYSIPTKHGDYYYFRKNDGLQNQSVMYRQKSLDGEAEIFLDPNKFSEDGTISLAGTSFTRDGSLMTYLISEGGSDWRKAIILNTETVEQIGDTLINIKFSGIAWKGNEGFYYSSYDKPKEGSELSGLTQYHKLFYHAMGTPQSEDELVFGGEELKRRYIGASVTEDSRFLVIQAAESTSGNELYIQDLFSAESGIKTIVSGFENDYSVLANEGDRIIIETNQDAPNNRLVETTFSNPDPSTWKDLVSETENVLNATTGGGKIFAVYMKDAVSSVTRFGMDGTDEGEVELPGLGTAFGFSGYSDDEELFYYFISFTDPNPIYKYDIESGESELFKRPEIDFDFSNYETKQVFYESKDGTKVPMFIVHKKGIELDGNNPTYLYAYGGFNISLTPNFSISRLVWLEQGGIYAQPNLRGGGEYGEAWHKAGIKMQKQNVFDDFIAAGEYLIREGYTNSEKLAIAGGSNGGLLVGATMTQRPDLARVAFPAVGVMDMLRYHKFTSGAGWSSDYGNSDESKEMFEYLKGYSPVHNFKMGADYPATLVTTGDHDDRVVPAHSFKFAATMQENHGGNTPVLIRIETDAGHGAGTPTSKIIEMEADRWSFAWYNMGFEPFLDI